MNSAATRSKAACIIQAPLSYAPLWLPAPRCPTSCTVEPDIEGQRLIPRNISQAFGIGPGGALVPLTPGSTAEVTTVMTQAGIVAIERFRFVLPSS